MWLKIQEKASKWRLFWSDLKMFYKSLVIGLILYSIYLLTCLYFFSMDGDPKANWSLSGALSRTLFTPTLHSQIEIT